SLHAGTGASTPAGAVLCFRTLESSFSVSARLPGTRGTPSPWTLATRRFGPWGRHEYGIGRDARQRPCQLRAVRAQVDRPTYRRGAAGKASGRRPARATARAAVGRAGADRTGKAGRGHLRNHRRHAQPGRRAECAWRGSVATFDGGVGIGRNVELVWRWRAA